MRFSNKTCLIVFFGVLLFGWHPNASAKQAIIRGKVADAHGLKVELITYTDYISNSEIKLSEVEIKEDGTFEIICNQANTIFAYLKIGVQKGEMFVEPGREYNIAISGLIEERLRGQDIAPFQIPMLNIEIMNPWRFELNGLMRDFYVFHDDFITENADKLRTQRQPGLAEQYRGQVYNLFPGIDNAWFNIMLIYKIAQIEMMVRSKSRDRLAANFLQDHKIYYDHMIYMDFFNQFFDKYLLTSRLFDRRELITALESADSRSKMLAILGKDPILSDSRLRELVLIHSSKEIFYSPGFDHDAIIDLLNQVKKNSKFDEHQQIAGNLIKLLTR